MAMNAEIEPTLHKIAATDQTVLLTGETGTGKTRLAEWIHAHSARRERALVLVNLATLHENLLESELFGHERGAFSGAEQKRIGKLELAMGGSVFLDEIGELPLRLQGKLLRFLNEGFISPVGSNREIKVNARVIAATNRNLTDMVADGAFREDLYYRLNTFQVELPALREQPGRIRALVADLLASASRRQGRNLPLCKEDFHAAVENYAWPGNIRELKNAVDFAVALGGETLDAAALPPYVRRGRSTSASQGEILPVDYQLWKSQAEKHYLEAMLKRFNGRINLTARSTRMSKVTLIEKIRRYEICVESIKYAGFRERKSALEVR